MESRKELVTIIVNCLFELRPVKGFVRIIVRCLIELKSYKGVC